MEGILQTTWDIVICNFGDYTSVNSETEETISEFFRKSLEKISWEGPVS